MMVWFVLGAALLAAAVVLWCTQAADGPPPAGPPEEGEGRFRQWLEKEPALLGELERGIRALEALMAHPELGGPGFLTARFPDASGGAAFAVVTAQYPNIREALYRLVLRRTPDRDALAAAGVPEALLALSPVFETDSGGVVLISVPVSAEVRTPTPSVVGLRERLEALEALSEALGQRFPEMEARPFGTELLLTPVREESRI